MSHKEKICQPALTSHIETSHDRCSYTPLIVSRKNWVEISDRPGLSAIIETELEASLSEKVTTTRKETEKIKKMLKANVSEAFKKTAEEVGNEEKILPMNQLRVSALERIDQDTEIEYTAKLEDIREETINTSEGTLDARNPRQAIYSRVDRLRKDLGDLTSAQSDVKPIASHITTEYDGLGLFFTESEKLRPEGKVYHVCGKEITLLPGEKINEKNVLKTVVNTEDAKTTTVSEELTTTNRVEVVDTFEESFERNLTKQLDLKYSRGFNLGLKIPFKAFNLDLGLTGNSSVDYKRILKEIAKSSHKQTKTQFDEAVRNVKSTNTTSSSLSTTNTEEYVYDRTLENKTDKTQIYMKRKGYCKTSVIHTRNNVQLAWTGCIDNPAKDLCTPDNIEDTHQGELQEIRDRWSTAVPPVDFGQRPAPRKVCTGFSKASNGIFATGPSNFNLSFQYTIPSGWAYEGGSASVDHKNESSSVLSKSVPSQPISNARGGVAFNAQVLLHNKFPKKEEVEFRVCFNILPDAAVQWDQRANEWRDAQAQKEIDAFLAKKTETLTEFLASDQARATIERIIMEKYFGITDINDCCKLIARLRKLFDFDSLCYSLLPSWNAMGEGCQKSNPVNIYTAKCLQFYVPMREGHEREAVLYLVSVNAIPWSPQLGPQIFAYITQVEQQRATLYNRVFDPSGWDVKFDQPKGYDMTPYDTSNPDWLSGFESGLNYEVLGAFTINIPCGERLEPRPLLCE